MQAKYLKGNCLFDIDCKPSDSDLWKAILKNRKTLQEGICRKIGDGRTTSIWFDNLVPSGNPKPRPLLDATQGVSMCNFLSIMISPGTKEVSVNGSILPMQTTSLISPSLPSDRMIPCCG